MEESGGEELGGSEGGYKWYRFNCDQHPWTSYMTSQLQIDRGDWWWWLCGPVHIIILCLWELRIPTPKIKRHEWTQRGFPWIGHMNCNDIHCGGGNPSRRESFNARGWDWCRGVSDFSTLRLSDVCLLRVLLSAEIGRYENNYPVTLNLNPV